MKKLLYLLCLTSIGMMAQQTTDFFPASNRIWIEDFSSYTNNTGVSVSNGTVTEEGDYANVTKWSIDASTVDASVEVNASINNLIDGVYSPSFNVSNTGGELTWESEPIDVSAYPNTFVSLAFANIEMGENDYIDVYWKFPNLGVSTYILIDRDNIGHTVAGTAEETCWKADQLTHDLTATTPDLIQIKVVFNSASENSILQLKKLEVLGTNN